MLKALLIGMSLLGLLACSAEQQIDLDERGGGRATLEFVVPVYLLKQADALSQNMPPGTPDFFDPKEVRRQLAANPGVKRVQVVSPRRGSMNISWEFDDLNQLLHGGKNSHGQELLGQALRLMKMADGRRRLELRLTRQNYDRLLAENPVLANNPILRYYGPSVTTEASPDDYHDLVEFAFGKQARGALDTAEFSLDITTPRPLLKVEGGSKLAARHARFVFKLMDLLYFNEADVYAIEY